jgi:hypothetical protein
MWVETDRQGEDDDDEDQRQGRWTRKKWLGDGRNLGESIDEDTNTRESRLEDQKRLIRATAQASDEDANTRDLLIAIREVLSSPGHVRRVTQ